MEDEIGAIANGPKPGTPEYEMVQGYKARAILAEIRGTLVREHSQGHVLMGEFCPICALSPKSK